VFGYVTSGSRGWAKYYASSGALFIRVGNVPRNAIGLDLSDVQRVEPPDSAEGHRTKVMAGDLLITITADIGRVAVVPDELGNAYINQHVALARPRTGLDPGYLAWFISSSRGQAQLRGLQRGATKLGLGLDDIRALQIPIPSISIQNEMASQLSAMADRAARLTGELERHSRRAALLRRSILAAAFSGQLVPQDHADEPASVLLERIQTKRAAAATRRRTRKAMVS
jgi:type I restriction enzyme S subunit